MASIWSLHELKEHTTAFRDRASQFGDKRTRKTTRSRVRDGFEHDEGRRNDLRHEARLLNKDAGCIVFDVFGSAWGADLATCARCGHTGGPALFSSKQLYAPAPRCKACAGKPAAAAAAAAPAAKVRKQLKAKNPFPKLAKRKAHRTAAAIERREKNVEIFCHENVVQSPRFLQLRQEFVVKFAKRILDTQLTISSIRPAPISHQIAESFVRLANFSSEFSLVFHGTQSENLASIFHRGLLPGGTHGIPVAHGTSYGTGIYAGRDALTSTSYCCGKGQMLVCALAEHHLGLVRDVGNFVVAKEGTVIPLLLMNYTYSSYPSSSRNPESLLETLLQPVCASPPPSPPPPAACPAPPAATTAAVDAPSASVLSVIASPSAAAVDAPSASVLSVIASPSAAAVDALVPAASDAAATVAPAPSPPADTQAVSACDRQPVATGPTDTSAPALGPPPAPAPSAPTPSPARVVPTIVVTPAASSEPLSDYESEPVPASVQGVLSVTIPVREPFFFGPAGPTSPSVVVA